MHSVSMTSYLATKGNVEQLLLEWRKQYGPFFEFQIPGSPPVMVVCDPDAIKEVSFFLIIIEPLRVLLQGWQNSTASVVGNF